MENDGTLEDLREIDWAFKEPRGRVLEVLREGDTISFKRLAERSEVRPSLCAYHLGLMVERGLVQRAMSPAPARREHSFYSLTERGRDLFKAREGLSDRGAPAEVPDCIRVIEWRDLPRCFVHER